MREFRTIAGWLAALRRFRVSRRRTAATPTLHGLLARSIERDGLLLLRLPRDQARRIAASIGDGRGHTGITVAAARRFALIDTILGEPTGSIGISVQKRQALGRMLAELALERGGGQGLAVLACAELGASELIRLAPPLRRELIEAALREIARSRSDTSRPPPRTSDPCLDALVAIEAALARLGALPFDTPFADMRPRSALAARAIRDWRDVSICAALLGPRAHTMWRAARDAAAFAGVWALPETLDALPPGDAARLQGDAERAARSVLSRGREPGPSEAARIVLVSCAAFVPA